MQLHPLLQHAVLPQPSLHQAVELAVVERRGAREPDRGNLHADDVIASVLQQQEVAAVGDMEIDAGAAARSAVHVGEMPVRHPHDVRPELDDVIGPESGLVHRPGRNAGAVADHQRTLAYVPGRYQASEL